MNKMIGQNLLLVFLSIVPLYNTRIISGNFSDSGVIDDLADEFAKLLLEELKNELGEPKNQTAQLKNETKADPAASSFGPRASGCIINLKSLQQRTPLIRDPRTNGILLPDFVGSSDITLNVGDRFFLDCPGSNIVVEPGVTEGETAEAECIWGSHVRISHRSVDFIDVVCSKRVASIARYTGRRCWGNKGQETEVGFLFNDGHFIQEMTTCFESHKRDVFYSLFTLTHQNSDQNVAGTRPGWTEGTFYNLDVRVDNIYPNVVQRVTINRLLGLPEESIEYVRPTGNNYLAKGHLTARADYMTYAQQEATFWYVNSVPQWQSLNGFNWAYLERNVRQYSARNRLDLTVMTGTYGISKLPHAITGDPTELYLFAEEDFRAMPVPELFWKVVYSPSTQAGIAILGINNPYLEDISDQIICPDIADQLDWISFDRTLLHRGYIYACTIAELRKKIPNIPNYRVTSILK